MSVNGMVFEYNEQSLVMKRGVILTFFLVSLVLLETACKGKTDKLSHQFYYYPDKNVYYDVAKQTFFYSIDGANSWQDFTGIANTDVSVLGKKVIINSADSLAYHDNENHRKLYAGHLYNMAFVNTAAPAASVAERTPVGKQKSVAKSRGGQKRKNGIGKFFAKIFGKGGKK